MVQKTFAGALALSKCAIRNTIVTLFAACMGLAVVGSAQAGFLEELFGGPSAAPDWPSPQLERRHAPPRRRVEVHRIMSVGTNASADASAAGSSPKKPQFCSWQEETSVPHDRTEALMRDATLRAGDVIMTDEGVRVFAGRAACPHTVRDFQTLAEASRALPRGERMVLAAMEQATKAKHFGSAQDSIVATDRAGATRSKRSESGPQ